MIRRLENIVLENNSDKICASDDNTSYTYADVNQRILVFSTLLEQYTFDQQSRIIVYIPNDTRAIISIFVIMNCNMVAVPVDIQTPTNVLIEMANMVDAKGIICLDKEKLEPSICNQCNLEIIQYCDNLVENTLKVNKIVRKDENDMALILFTSGTTGKFKAVVHSHMTVLYNIFSVMDYMNVNEDDKFYIMKTYVHCSSLLSEIFVALYAHGSFCIYKPKVGIRVTIDRIMKEKPTVLGVNPTFLRLLTNINRNDLQSKLESIRVAVTSGAIILDDLLSASKELFRNGTIINVYGLTEAGPRVSAQRPECTNKNGSVGYPIKNVQVKIDDINTYGMKNAGEVLVKTPSMMLCYWNNKVETDKKIVDGWLRTGDLGYFDKDGELHIIGRNDDMIIRSSHNVDPYRIDIIIEKMKGIKQSITFGVPDEMNGHNIVSAVVVDKEDTIQSKEILSFCQDRLYNYELPTYIMFVKEIPMTIGKKVSRKKLQEEYYRRISKQ